MEARSEAQAAIAVSFDGAGGLTSFIKENLDITRRQPSPDLSEEEIERLVGIAPNQIRSLLATEGYFSSTATLELNRESTPLRAHFIVTPGPRTLVDSATITFNGEITQKDPERVEKLQSQWGLKPGSIFQQKAWDDAKSDLLKGLLIQDYPAAAIAQSEARIEPSTTSASLTVDVDSGPAFTFGTLQVEGLQRYRRDMIDELNPIEPGDPYSQEKLNDLQARVQDTGYFKSAFATVHIDPSKPDLVPVRLDLTENKRKRLSLGVGYSTDSGARGQVKWLDRNFMDRDWRLESELQLDRESRVLGSDFYLPPVSNGWRPSLGAHYEYTDSAGELNHKVLTGARITSPDKNNEKIWALSFLADRQRVGDMFSNNREALIASFTYTRRRVNNLILPTRGYVASIELGAGPGGLVNPKSLARVVASGTFLSPYFSKRWQAVLRAHVGQVFGATRDTVPGDLLFRTGGDQSVRGYGFNELGVAQNGAIVGGTVTAVVSAEMVYRITPEWGAAIFTDAGNAADSWQDFKLQQGSGFGARWRSPVGQVNVDLAYGHETRKPRLHFSIGYGF